MLDQQIALQAEHDPVDGFEGQAIVVDVLDLDQRVARGVVHADLRLVLLPDGLGSGQRVVAVAHGKQQDLLPTFQTVALLEGSRIGQLFERL